MIFGPAVKLVHIVKPRIIVGNMVINSNLAAETKFVLFSPRCTPGYNLYIIDLLLGGILGQNLKNRPRRSNQVRTSLDPKWPAESIYAIARSYR